jgi:hypothetical protein
VIDHLQVDAAFARQPFEQLLPGHRRARVDRVHPCIGDPGQGFSSCKAKPLADAEPLNPQLLSYINRLSDHLFVAARHVAARQGGDVLWQPGATRG